MLRCIYCGLCQEVCPRSDLPANSFHVGYTREVMVNHKDRLYERAARCPISI